MEPSLLPLMLLLISNIHPGQTQDRPNITVKPQNSVFTGDRVTLSCDVERSPGQKINWYKDYKGIQTGYEKEILRDTVRVSDGGRYACGVAGKIQSHGVMLNVRERPKPVVRVDPDGHVFRGQTVTLTCHIQQTDVSSWVYSWNKDDSLIHVSQTQEYRISSVNESHTGHYSCTGRETQGSRQSHTSDKVTLTVSGSSVSIFPEALFNALIVGGIGGLSGAFLLIFLMVLLFCCKRKKGEGSPPPSTDHPQNISQTSAQQGYGQTPSCSNTVTGPSSVTYVKVNLKSTEEMKRKKENKGEPYYDTIYSNVKI